MSVISAVGLTKRYRSVTALEGLSVEIPLGVTGLVGANGAGKSTLIKILLGLLPATSGAAKVMGQDVATEGPAIRERVGYMPEHDCLPLDLSATEFVVQMARMSGLPMSAARERAADVLRHVGLYEERYRAIDGYSTGMRQRVKLAQALAHDPQLVLLDEPTNGLDPAGRDDMLALIRRVGTDFGISVLVTSHLLGELERICDHVVVLDGGHLLRSSSTAAATATAAVLLVEVDERLDALVDALGQLGQHAGPAVSPSGHALPRTAAVQLAGDATYDAIRDAVAWLGVGLVRLEQQRHQLSEIFTGAPGVGSVPGTGSASGSGGVPGAGSPPADGLSGGGQ